MGWWVQDTEGHSLILEPTGDLFWGDGPADVMDDALDAIDNVFLREQGRKPTLEEIQAGVLFSARIRYNEKGEDDDQE